MADNTGLFGDGMMGGYGNNITAANIIRSRVKQPLYQAAMENADTGSIRATPPTKFESWLNESGQRLMNPTDTIAQGVQNFTQQDPVDMGMSLLNGGMGGALGTFAGVGAKTADVAKLELAQKLKQAGVADREIHAQTGWTFGFPDGRPRFEIDDSAAKGQFTHLPPSTDRLAEQAISHPSLYQAYPDLSEISQLGLRESKEAGRFTPTYIDDAYSGGSILAKAPDEAGLKSIGLHELQHAVQQQEGFARGGSPNIELSMLANSARAKFRKGSPLTEEESQLAKLTPIEAARPYDIYRRLAGEAEARLTQARMNMTQAERAASYPPSMFDVPVDQQIVRFGDGPAMSTNTNNQPLVNALRKPTAGELAQKLAHDRAMLPVSEHGLGLPAGNTAMDRADVMFPKDVYHSTDADILNMNPSAGGKLGPGVYTSDSPDYVNKYILHRPNKYVEGGNVMPLRIKDNLASPDTAELARQDTSHLGTPPDVKNYKTYWKQQVNDELANRGYSGRTIDGPIYDGMENVTFNPEDIRSRFAAFDPWRRNAAIAALTGTAAPDLMAGENDNLVNALRSK